MYTTRAAVKVHEIQLDVDLHYYSQYDVTTARLCNIKNWRPLEADVYIYPAYTKTKKTDRYNTHICLGFTICTRQTYTVGIKRQITIYITHRFMCLCVCVRVSSDLHGRI